MSLIHKIIMTVREKRLKTEMKEYVRFKIYLPVIRIWNLVVDKYYGIDTELIIELPSLGLDSKIGNRQESTPTRHLKKILSFLPINSEDIFIDIGSGLGRVMIAAGCFPFKKIIGVDVSEKLNKICEINIQKMKHRLKCRKFENITSNASDYRIPDEATFIYFFNPFGMEVMKDVFHSISKSVSVNPRKVIIICYNPKYDRELEQSFPIIKIMEMNWANFGLFNSRCLFYEMSIS